MTAAQPDEVWELDKLWSFVGHHRRGVWLWLALCRRTRQIVADALGPRDDATARLLWMRIPPAYRQGLLCTDRLESDHNVLPTAQHQAAYSKGFTNRIERFNNTLRLCEGTHGLRYNKKKPEVAGRNKANPNQGDR